MCRAAAWHGQLTVLPQHMLTPAALHLHLVPPRRFTHIPLVASLAGGLSQFRESLGVALVDAVLEDIR